MDMVDNCELCGLIHRSAGDECYPDEEKILDLLYLLYAARADLEAAQAEIARLREAIEAAGILLKLMWDRSEDWTGSRPSSHFRSDIHDLILRFLADATALKEGE